MLSRLWEEDILLDSFSANVLTKAMLFLKIVGQFDFRIADEHKKSIDCQKGLDAAKWPSGERRSSVVAER